jgi:hypothetical protein
MNKLRTNVKPIKLKSSDGIVFEVSLKLFFNFCAINTLENKRKFSQNECILIQNINSFVLQKVIHWTQNHLNDRKLSFQEKGLNFDEMNEFDTQFILENESIFVQLLMASKYLGIQTLYECITKVLANLMIHNNVQQIRQLFGISNDFDVCEEDIIRLNNKWAEQSKHY